MTTRNREHDSNLLLGRLRRLTLKGDARSEPDNHDLNATALCVEAVRRNAERLAAAAGTNTQQRVLRCRPGRQTSPVASGLLDRSRATAPVPAAGGPSGARRVTSSRGAGH
jgi:hypothetical protein